MFTFFRQICSVTGHIHGHRWIIWFLIKWLWFILISNWSNVNGKANIHFIMENNTFKKYIVCGWLYQ